ncbi:MAG: hypothetical protein AMXMBFR13_26920 [Phycisphaerae bacterium]
MKILAQSTVPSNPWYLHLGYLAAGTTYTDRPLAGVAVGMMVLGLLAMASLRAIRTAGRLDFRPMLRSRPVWVAGLLVMAAGAGVLWFGPSTERRHPEEYTRYIMKFEARFRVEGEHESGALASLSEDAFAQRFADLEDGWYRKLRVVRLNPEPATYEVRSAGPDGRFETADDVVQQLTPAGKQAGPPV